jgi:hypothetical protein
MATVQNNLIVIPGGIRISTDAPHSVHCVESPIRGIEGDPDQSNHGPEARHKQSASKEPMMPIAINQWGFRAQFDDNPHLENPGVRFIEEHFVEWEQRFGEGAEAGFANSFEKWRKANSKHGPNRGLPQDGRIGAQGGS